MYEQVIKFGAQIVDALHSFNQPIIIYIPPFAELRGGSWVVIDPTINATQMEMYADSTSRGGVLEAEGTVSIKLRLKDQKPIMERLDPEMRKLIADLKVAHSDRRPALEAAIKARIEVLSPIYHQVAVQFADLHDTPSRMKAKGVIRDIVEWRESRTRLFWRLKRRLHEKKFMTRIEKTGATLNHGQKTELMRRWFRESAASGENYHFDLEDKPVAEWLLEQLKDETANQVVKDNLKVMREESIMYNFRGLLGRMTADELHEAGIYLAQRLPPAKKEEFVEAVRTMMRTGEDELEDQISGSPAKEPPKSQSQEDKKMDDSSASENGEPF